jgi:hypothetical protein
MTEDIEYDTTSWMLGDDSDCDTCGWSYNEAEFDPHFSDENEWSFHYRVGCYSGDSVSWYDDNREEKLAEMFDHLSIFSGWSRDNEKVVRNMIKECDDARS